MIVDVASYTDGRRRDCTDSQDLTERLCSCRSSGEGFVWIGLKDPTAAEFDEVSGELGLHPLAVEDAVRGRQRPKVERYGDTLFVVLKVLAYSEPDSSVETGEVMVFLGEHFVVTVRRGDVGSLAPVRQGLEAEPERLRLGPSHVLHAVLDHVVDGYVAVDRELELDVEQMEEQVLSPTRTDDAARIYNLKREVLEVRRAASPLLAALRAHVASGADPAGSGSQEVVFALRDVVDHLERTVEHVEGYDRLLSDILNAHLAQVSVRQNEDMRRISAWAAIFGVETLIAGIYGMNFELMPELGWTFGYPLVLLLMLVVGLLVRRRFRRAGWL